MDVSDVESADDLKELEASLYGLIHHEAVQLENGELLVGELGDFNLNQSTEKNQDRIFCIETAGVASSISLLNKRDHLDKPPTLQDRNEPMTNQSLMENGENQDCRSSVFTIASNFKTMQLSPLNEKNKEKDQEPKKKLQKPKNDKIKMLKTEPNIFNRNVRILQGNQKAVMETEVRGLFGKQAIKLEKLKRLEAKKGKSLKVHNKKIQSRQSDKQEQVNEIIDLDSSGDDDVIIVPLQASPVIDVEDSNDVEENKNHQTKDNDSTIESTPYIEENALDAADIVLPIVDMWQKSAFDVTPIPGNQVAICNSPCSSILSTDDFIGQKDRRRLNNSYVGPGADDEDLILLTSDVSAFLKPVSGQKETLQTHAALPCNVPVDKESYRVEQNQLRSIDVYDSESDITESGIYSKTKSGQKATIIRSVDSSSTDEDHNVQIVESATSAQKNKVFRKRRPSNSKKESALHRTEDIDTTFNVDNSDDEETYSSGLHPTGVPYISRGIAVERCNWGERRRASESAMSDNRFIESLNNLAKGEQANNEWSNPEPICAEELNRPLAEKEQEKSIPITVETGKQGKEDKTASSDVFPDDSNAVPKEACQGLEEIFNQIDSITTDTKAKEDDIEIVHIKDTLPKDGPIITIDDNDEKNETTCSKRFGWNNEMNCFYNDSWHGEDFNLNLLLAKLENRQQLWNLRLIDRVPKSTQKSNLKCFNCCEFGHIRSKCKQPKKKIVCSTCGEFGHQETRCPHSMCLGCGHKTQLYVRSCNNCSFERRLICPLCKVRGHGLNSCPDKWRRYHSTTQMNVPLENKVKYNEKKHCSVCGGVGHLAEICKSSLRFMDYPSVLSTIKSHRKVYDDRTECEIMVEASPPSDRFKFRWRKHLQGRSYYARFLKAVGLEHNLKRKTKNGFVQTIPKKKLKIINPALKVRNSASSTSQLPPPNQVQEISESCSTDEQTEQIAKTQTESDIGKHDAQVHKNRFKAPMNVERMSATSSTAAAQIDTNEKELLLNFDSDSNYSFSEHFELPTSTTTTFPAVRSRTTPRVIQNLGVMDNLPEMIPLNSDETSDKYNTDNFMPTISGISMCFSGELPEQNHSIRNPVTNEATPCECKIYLQDSDTDFLLSPNGDLFLTNLAKLCNVNVRMEQSSIGYVLIAYGKPNDQTQLHIQLLKKCKDERNKILGYQAQKPPKRVDALIKFLREGICQLFNNLGNANDHHKGLIYQQKQNTKNGIKTADKKRRLLNMILLGQAGLLNGSMHLDKLLHTLQRLITEFEPNALASDNLRNDVEKHWRLIFTPYQQDNYYALLRTYNKLATKNRLYTLQIDPKLLGQKVLNTTLNLEQQVSRPMSRDTNNTAVNKNRSTNADLLDISTSVPRPSSNLLRQDLNHQKTTPKRALESMPPCANPGQLSNINRQNGNIKNANIDTIFPDLDVLRGPGNKSSRANQPSMFWSREALKYVDKCLRLTTNTLYVSRLKRVQSKSQNGHLSHNDYSAIVRLYYSLANN